MLMEILSKYVSGKEKHFKYDRMQTVGASEIGACARRTFYLKNAERRDRDHLARWGATHRGDLIEQHLVVPALRARFGRNLLWSGKSQRNFQEKYLSATPDGLLINCKRDMLRYLGVKDLGSTSLLVEIKSIDPRANLEKEKHQHRLQAIAQCGLVRLKTPHRPNYVLIIYIDASFHDEIKEFVVKFEPDVFATLEKRAAQILTAKVAKDLHPEGWIAGGFECETCPWKDACGIDRHALPSERFKGEPVDPQRVAEMTDLCRQAQQMQSQCEMADAKLRTQQEKIRERLREWDLRRIPGVVTLSQVKGRTSYNLDALKQAAEKAGVDPEQFSRIGEPTTRLTISLPSE